MEDRLDFTEHPSVSAKTPAGSIDDPVPGTEAADDRTEPESSDTHNGEPENAGENPEVPAAVTRRNGSHDALLPVSVIGGLVGMLAGTLPASICALIFGAAFSPLYVFLPLLISLGIRLFKGFSGKNGVITVVVFSVIGFYLTLLSCQAAVFVIHWHVPVFSLPLVTITMIGKPDVLQGAALSSAYIFPFVFALLGVFLSREFMLRRKGPAVFPEPGPEEKTA